MLHRVFPLSLLLLFGSSLAQEVTPRRWTHLPVGATFVAPGMALSDGEVYFDPVLRAENVEVEAWTTLIAFAHSFAVAGKTARVDLIPSWNEEKWTGVVDGENRSVSRSGWNDLALRFSVNLLGSPALSGKEYADYRAQHPTNTVVGTGIKILAPIGEYQSDKLVNLGKNRWSVQPQLGVTHTWGNWSVEGTGALFLWSDNDDFFNDSKREQDPLVAVQGHLVYFWRPGTWLAGSLAWGVGGENTINGEAKNDETENLLWSLRAGVPINPKTGLTFGWIQTETQTDRGADIHSFLVTVNRMF